MGIGPHVGVGVGVGIGTGSGGARTFALTATTTAPGQTVTLYRITPTGQDVLLDWGDGTTETIADGNAAAKTHVYAAAGSYAIRLPYVEYSYIDIRDGAVGGTVNAANLFPQVTTSVSLYNLPNLAWIVSEAAPFPSVSLAVGLGNLPGLVWTVGAEAPFPAVTNTLTLNNLPNLTWTVGAAPFPALANNLILNNLPGLVWTVGAAAPFPAVTITLALNNLPNLTWTVGAAATLHSASAITYESNLSQAAVDTVLSDLYSAFPARTKAGTIDLLGGGNAAPSGVSPGSAECPPATGWNTAYELVNDSCGIAAFHWTSVSLQT